MVEAAAVADIKDELELVVVKRSKADDFCWACGPKGTTTKVGEDWYMVTVTYLDEEAQADWEYMEFCPKHLAFLLNAALTHLMRVDRGKEKGPLTLPLLQSKGVPA